MKRALAFTLSVVALLGGCGPEFDPPSQIDSLRVLAVQKSQPYARPGETVDLDMLWHDPEGRDVQIGWVAGCFNPPGDLFSGCFQQVGSGGDVDPTLGLGDRFSFEMPADIIASRPPPLDSNQPPYGLAVVFFAACAGELELGADAMSAFALSCVDDEGRPLGADRFVAGYSMVFAYDDLRNENAMLDGFFVGGEAVAVDCVGAECLDLPAELPQSCEEASACVDACPDDGEDSCPEIAIRPGIDSGSVERDDVSSIISGTETEEQIWVRYFVDRGAVESDVRLVNDASTGFNADYGTVLFAPELRGPLLVWAVVQDNRGGANWVRATLFVQ